MRIKINTDNQTRHELAIALEFVLEELLHKAHEISISETKLTVLRRRSLKTSILINERIKTGELINEIEQNLTTLQTVVTALKAK